MIERKISIHVVMVWLLTSCRGSAYWKTGNNPRSNASPPEDTPVPPAAAAFRNAMEMHGGLRLYCTSTNSLYFHFPVNVLKGHPMQQLTQAHENTNLIRFNCKLNLKWIQKHIPKASLETRTWSLFHCFPR